MLRIWPKNSKLVTGLRVIKTRDIGFIDVERALGGRITIALDEFNLAITLDIDTAEQIAKDILRRVNAENSRKG